jgi:CRISPR/Cas system endoribonuclease Cas6 (RAMP superfamily)
MSESEKWRTALATERFRFSIRLTSLTVLPSYKGGVFRGAFGSVFRSIVCATKAAECQNCLVRTRCLYAVLFEPQAPPDHLDAHKFKHAPSSYVLNPPLTKREAFRPGEKLDFELVLIGRAVDALPYFVYTFMEMGKRGIGRERGKYELQSVDVLRNGAPAPVYDGGTKTLISFAPGLNTVTCPADVKCSRVTLEFLTPLRLKVKGDLVTRLSFPILFERLVHRLALLAAFYGKNGDAPDLAPLFARAQEISVDHDELHWHDWERYSARQQSAMKLGGLRGKITFSGDLGPFMPFLRLGAEVNVGQGTSFGLGRYQTQQFSQDR